MYIYCVRQKSTGYYIPKLPSGYRKGGSYTEPEKNCIPRIFYSKNAATSFINTWIKGIYNRYGESVTIQNQDHRNKDDMEIIEFELFETSKLGI